MACGVLEVQIVDAKKLRDTKLFCKMNPYVLIHYEDHVQKSCKGKGKNPVWDDKLSFRTEYEEGSKNQHKISFRIMDHESFSYYDRLIGESAIYVKDVLSLGVEDGKAELSPRKYRVVLTNKNYHGEIRVGVTFTRDQVEDKESEDKEIEDKGVEDFGGWKQSSKC